MVPLWLASTRGLGVFSRIGKSSTNANTTTTTCRVSTYEVHGDVIIPRAIYGTVK